MAANRAPQPARLDGKGIEYFAKRERNPTSRVTRPAVANAVRRATSSADDDDGDGDDDDAEEEEEEAAAEEESAKKEEEEEAVGYPQAPLPRERASPRGDGDANVAAAAVVAAVGTMPHDDAALPATPRRGEGGAAGTTTTARWLPTSHASDSEILLVATRASSIVVWPAGGLWLLAAFDQQKEISYYSLSLMRERKNDPFTIEY
jgi:pyruvate/2-oxoglutarate dehydrogenase complex dihydrolipoamide acyltransferase (E2) component